MPLGEGLLDEHPAHKACTAEHQNPHAPIITQAGSGVDRITTPATASSLPSTPPDSPPVAILLNPAPLGAHFRW
ncbi:hypothetical protein Mam01_71230 [Microbispora amethystogenes]|uniref:Uncharacterized protein n=1 Tax=Microbispora amethystogenes TaxID=1427754 RepID=A0ABQ4FQ66_9ACTN|nr:hypothetical protein Mam01_71230 [Microbispora amethystogenes]